ncbi:MAG: hypothetical protein ACFHVJ_16415 [Aestuariibacter sp.]
MTQSRDMIDLNDTELSEVHGAGGLVGGAIGGAIGAVGGFFVGVGSVAFGSNTQSVSSAFTSIGISTFQGALTGATIGSGAGVVASVASAVGGAAASEVMEHTLEKAD